MITAAVRSGGLGSRRLSRIAGDEEARRRIAEGQGGQEQLGLKKDPLTLLASPSCDPCRAPHLVAPVVGAASLAPRGTLKSGRLSRIAGDEEEARRRIAGEQEHRSKLGLKKDPLTLLASPRAIRVVLLISLHP